MSKIMNVKQFIELAEKYSSLTREDWEDAKDKLNVECAKPTSVVKDVLLMRSENFAIMNLISGFGSNYSCTLCLNVDCVDKTLDSGEKSINRRKSKPNCTQCVWGCIAFTEEYFDMNSYAIISQLTTYKFDLAKYEGLFSVPCVFSKTYSELERALEKGYVPDIIFAINKRGAYMKNLIKKFRLEEL